MNVVELQRALRQLRCSGIAAALETRLIEAQAEKLAPIVVQQFRVDVVGQDEQ